MGSYMNKFTWNNFLIKITLIFFVALIYLSLTLSMILGIPMLKIISFFFNLGLFRYDFDPYVYANTIMYPITYVTHWGYEVPIFIHQTTPNFVINTINSLKDPILNQW